MEDLEKRIQFLFENIQILPKELQTRILQTLKKEIEKIEDRNRDKKETPIIVHDIHWGC